MKILVPNFDNYKLIAIRTKLDDYHVAYLINKVLGLKLTRQKESLNFENNGACFSIYEYFDEQILFQYHLIQNKAFKTIENESEVAFFKDFFFKKTYLVEEKEEVDFFLRIEDGGEKHVSRLSELLNSIEDVILAYSIKISQLKSKYHLIF